MEDKGEDGLLWEPTSERVWGVQAKGQAVGQVHVGADKPEDKVFISYYLIHAQWLCLPEDEENKSGVFR